MAESSSDDDFCRVDSGSGDHDNVPRDTEFKVKIKYIPTVPKKKSKCFEYVLKKGIELPHFKELLGHSFFFNRDLSINMTEDNWTKQNNDNCIQFTEIESSSAKVDDFNQNQEYVQVTVNNNFESPSDAVIIDSEVIEALRSLVLHEDNVSRCGLCKTFVSSDQAIVIQHILTIHPRWQDEKQNIQNSETQKVSNEFLHPNWKRDLQNKFQDLIIMNCSKMTRDAWDNNEKLDGKRFREVRSEILRRLIDHIIEVFGKVSAPSIADLRQIVNETLSVGYPFMFGKGEGTAQSQEGLGFGHGKGGIWGVEALPKQLKDRILKNQLEIRVAEQEQFDEDSTVDNTRKGKKRPTKYGVDNYKFYSKSTAEQRSKIEQSVNIEDDEEREKVYETGREVVAEQIAAHEEVYDRNREAIHREASNSKKLVQRVVKGFFNSRIHVHKQFGWLTGVYNLKDNILKNWDREILRMKEYIKKKDKKGDILKEIKEVEEVVETEYGGSRILYDISVIRGVAKIIDKKKEKDGDGRTFILLPGETVMTPRPFIRAKEQDDRSFKFEIWADNEKVLDGQDLVSALASYFELAFTFQLEYPVESAVTINLVQLKIVNYGNVDKGSLTKMAKTTVGNKIKRYDNEVDKE